MSVKTQVVGTSVSRKDALEKVTGAAKFVDDIKFGPGLLHAKLLRSPYPHARIVSMNTSEAEALPGVRAVATGKEFNQYIGLYLLDRTLYAVDKVRYLGEPVAGVAAETEEIAEEALGLIEVQYEELPGIFDPQDALKPESPILHEKLGDYECAPFIFPEPGTNISNYFKVRKGDVESAFRECSHVTEQEYFVPHLQHTPLETHVAVAKLDGSGNYTLWTSSQSPFAQRNLIAKSMGIPYHKLRVITPYVGGGFGSKAGVSIEACVIPLAIKASPMPVKLRMTREEEFYCTFVRQGLKAKVKIGVDSEGKILAMENTYYWDAGAYTEYGVNITRAAGYSSTGPYLVPNVKADSYCCYTNHPVGGPMRGFGMPEIHWAIEQAIDTICCEIGMDPVEFRVKNALAGGDISVTGGVMHPNGLKECILKAAHDLKWNEPIPEAEKGKKTGRGVAAMWKAPAMPPDASSGAILKFNEDATVNLLISGMEIGQGTHTVMAQMAAEVLGIPYESIRVHTPDTNYSPYEWQTVASRLTWSMGNAVVKAAEDAKQQLLDLAANHWGCSPDELNIQNAVIIHKEDSEKKIPLKDSVIYGIRGKDGNLRGGPIIGRGNFIPPDVTPLDRETGQGPKSVVHFTTGAQAVEIEIDEETGVIHLRKVTSCYDVGKAINPMNVICQSIGGIYMGLSTGLFEQLKMHEGTPLNNNLSDYVTATVADMPDEIHASFVEVPQEDGPFGARGVGEHTMVPTAPAIANAVYNALGVRIRSMPITPEKILCALKQKDLESKEKAEVEVREESEVIDVSVEDVEEKVKEKMDKKMKKVTEEFGEAIAAIGAEMSEKFEDSRGVPEGGIHRLEKLLALRFAEVGERFSREVGEIQQEVDEDFEDVTEELKQHADEIEEVYEEEIKEEVEEIDEQISTELEESASEIEKAALKIEAAARKIEERILKELGGIDGELDPEKISQYEKAAREIELSARELEKAASEIEKDVTFKIKQDDKED